MSRLLRFDELAIGLAVEYLGDDQQVRDWGSDRVVGVLYRGHPGRLDQLHQGQHVIVTWLGLEDTDESQVVGHSMNDQWCYPGLGILDEQTLLQRTQAIRAGRRPTT
jgi:hypothetical protein